MRGDGVIVDPALHLVRRTSYFVHLLTGDDLLQLHDGLHAAQNERRLEETKQNSSKQTQDRTRAYVNEPCKSRRGLWLIWTKA